MQFSKKYVFRILSFILVFFALYGACEYFLLKFEGQSYVIMQDLKKETDLDLVAIGNSEALRHFNPFLFQEITGKNSFNLSRSASSILTQYILMEEAFQTHSPETMILFVDPFTLKEKDESPIVQAAIWPHIENPLHRLYYAFTLASKESTFLDRLFPWRLYMVESLSDLVSNIQNKTNNDNYYNQAYLRLNNKTHSYAGKGFNPSHSDQTTTLDEINKLCNSLYAPKEYAISESIKKLLQRMSNLCNKNNCELIVISVPRLPSYAIAKLLNVYDAQTQLFNDLNIPYWNFCYAKDTIMPQLDVSYYFDDSHLTEAGANILTKSLAHVFNAYQNGEDVTSMFYTTEEYLASIDYVTNAWLTQKNKGDQTQFVAYSNHGTLVTPEYCFSKIDSNGFETVLQEYSSENSYSGTLEEGEIIRLYTRNASNLAQEPLVFEFD